MLLSKMLCCSSTAGRYYRIAHTLWTDDHRINSFSCSVISWVDFTYCYEYSLRCTVVNIPCEKWTRNRFLPECWVSVSGWGMFILLVLTMRAEKGKRLPLCRKLWLTLCYDSTTKNKWSGQTYSVICAEAGSILVKELLYNIHLHIEVATFLSSCQYNSLKLNVI